MHRPPLALPTDRPLRVAIVTQHQDTGGMPESVLRGFQALGVDAHLVRYSGLAGKLRFVGGRAAGLLYDVATGLTRPLAEVEIVRDLVRLDPDLILFIKADELTTAAYLALARLTRARIVAFHPDDPFNVGRRLFLRRKGGPSHVRARVQMRHADVYLTWSEPLVARARAAGAREVHFLPFACDPALHPRSEATDIPEALRADVVFIGNWDPERERWLAAVAALPGVNFAIWGLPSWRTHCRTPALTAAWRQRPLYGEEMSLAIAGGAIHLNILRGQNKGAHNMRTFEIPCAGGFMLHERSAEAAALMPPGDACDDFATPEELCAKVAHWLARPDERAAVRERGYAIARRHTYAHWAQRVVALALGAEVAARYPVP